MVDKFLFKNFVLVAILTFSNTLYGSFAETYGFNTKSVSKGNAVTATVDDWSSVYYNVAGLGKNGKDKNSEVALSYMFSMPNIDLKIDKEVPDSEDLSLGTLTLGLTLDLNMMFNFPKIVSSARFGLGMSVMQDGSLISINDVSLKAHSFLRYGNEIKRLVIFAGLGFGFLDDMFGIGFGANILTKGEGKVVMTDLELNSNEQTPPQEIKMNLDPAMSPTIGLYFKTKGIDLGLSYRGEIYMELPLDTDATMMIGSIELPLKIFILDFYTPASVTLGGAYTFKGLTISADLEYQLWSKFKVSQAHETCIKNYNQEKGTNVKLPEFKNILIPKLGFSYKVMNSLKVNAGYFFRPTFLPEDSNKTLFNFLDSNTNVISLGTTYFVPKNGFIVGSLELNLSAQFQLLSEKDVIKDSKFKTKENPDYSYGGNVISVFAGMLLKF